MGKVCRNCGIEKDQSEFYKNKFSKDRLTYECKVCWLVATKKYRENNPDKIKEVNKRCYLNKREERIIKQRVWSINNQDKVVENKKKWKLKNPEYSRILTLRKHGISYDDFWEMMCRQFHKCWICKKPFNKHSDAKIDHCHKSGTIRGLLCNGCNTSIGLMKENISAIKIMAHYLENNKDGFKDF